jgi:hypothetical protein
LILIPHNFVAASSIGSFLAEYWGIGVALLVVFFGLFVIGLGDTKRFSLTRAWAISGVCFDESIRKRVLWITPLAIAGVIGITQFQRALDEQDAIRQSVKICLFATGLVVMLTSIILACTNLPKEIESRVIYTILTKPTTRLELIVGKVLGFARVSLAIVAIMGVFTWLYVRISSEQKRQQISYRLQEGDVSETERARLSEYSKAGLLATRRYSAPDQLSIYGQPPQPGTNERVISNEGDQDVLAGFVNDRSLVFGPPKDDPEDWAHEGAGQNGLVIRLAVNAVRQPGPSDDQPPAPKVYGPTLNAPSTQPTKLLNPRVAVQMLDENLNDMYLGTFFVGASNPEGLKRAIAIYYQKGMKVDAPSSGAAIRLGDPVTLPDGQVVQYGYAWLPPNQAISIFNHQRFVVRLSGGSINTNYFIGSKPISVFVPQPRAGGIDIDGPAATEIPPSPGRDGDKEMLIFRGRVGLHYDQEMSGGQDAPGATADYAFINPPAAELVNGEIPFQFEAEVDRSNAEVQSSSEDATKMSVSVFDETTKKLTPLAEPIYIESRLPTFFSIPASAVSGGSFHIYMHCLNTSQSVGLYPYSLEMVASSQLFEINLAKSLSIIWMMSVLVIVLAIFSSTFLSWPIAIVLTVLLLLGHWGVEQVADSSGPGLGRQIVNDFKFSDVAISKVVSTGVDSLSRVLNIVSGMLPDTSRFNAIDDIQQGVSISSDTILSALEVLIGFGVPAIVLSYLILLGKEVAP